MTRRLESKSSLTIEANVSPCAHICRYCSIGDRGPKFAFDRWLSLVDKFEDWVKSGDHDDIHVQHGFYPSYDFDITTYAALIEWYKKHELIWNGISLGGLQMRSDDDMRRWLAERQTLGLESIGATFVGHGAVHDRWNGRRGDFEYIMRTMRTAVELGLKHSDQHILTKSSLPLMLETFEKLDALPTPTEGRYVRPAYYIGHGAHHDDELLTEAERENIPDAVVDLLVDNNGGFVLRSEREWIEFLRDEEDLPQRVALHLELTGENIDALESQSCAEIFQTLDVRARDVLSILPSLQELADIHGDRHSTKLFMSKYDIERFWLYQHLEAHPIEYDASLLHYHLGRSRNPPPLWD